MPKIDIARIALDPSTNYPPPFDKVVAGRAKQRLGNAVGLTQFGVNLTRLQPGAASALRHWHREEDELVYILEGELVLIEDDVETVLRPGDAAGFKAGVQNAHCLINRSDREAVYLEIGTRAPSERAEYPDIDCMMVRDGKTSSFKRRSGEPYVPSKG